jgi:hypothetical protein
MSGHNDCRQQPDGQCQDVFFTTTPPFPFEQSPYLSKRASDKTPKYSHQQAPNFAPLF